MVQENNDTRGLTQRELLLEVRTDVKDLNRRLSKSPTRMEIYGTIGLGASLIFGIVAFVA